LNATVLLKNGEDSKTPSFKLYERTVLKDGEI